MSTQVHFTLSVLSYYSIKEENGMKTEVLQILKLCISQTAFINCVSVQLLISVIHQYFPSFITNFPLHQNILLD